MGFLKWLFGSNNNTDTPANTKLFDENDFNEFLPLIRNLSWLVANVGSYSSLYVTYRDAAKNDSGVSVLSVCASLDDWITNGNTNTAESFIKNGISASVAKYLASVPFTIAGDALIFTFKNAPSSLSHLKSSIVSEIRSGLALSDYVKAGVRNIRIEENIGVITCRVD